MSDDTCLVKTYSEINQAVERRRLEPQCRVWYLARFLDPIGRGCVFIGQLHQLIKEHHLFSRRTLGRALRQNCIFYNRDGNILWLRSIHKVAAALDVQLRDRPAWIPLVAFSSRLKLRQAFMASTFAHKPRTVAHDTLAELIGRSRRTVIRHLDSEYIVKTPNAMICRRDPTLDLTPEMAQEGHFHGRVAGKTVLLKRMPNTYTTTLEPAAYGQVKQQRLSPSATPKGDFDRRYFSSPKGASRALQALQPYHTLYLLSGNCFDDMGSQLWRGYWCLDPHGPNHEL